MTPAIAAAGLTGLALTFAWLVPRVLARLTALRRTPRAALVLWQSVSIAAVVSALAAAPVAAVAVAVDGVERHPLLLGVALVVSLGMFVRLLLSGHRIGTRIRAVRQRHDDLVHLLGTERPQLAAPLNAPSGSASSPASSRSPGLRRHRRPQATVHVIQHELPTAYCIPGGTSGVVLSQGMIDTLAPDELAAVLAHERAHLRTRHDLLVEFFTVLHKSVPAPLRCQPALREVRRLVELLADQGAAREVGAEPLARALAAMTRGTGTATVAGTLGVNEAATAAAIRITLAEPNATGHPGLAAIVLLVAGLALAAPVALVASVFMTH